MICENCKDKIATSYQLVNKDGKESYMYLCQYCRSLLVGDDAISVKSKFDDKNRFCHNCGTTLKDFIASSYVGCETCYTEFSDVVSKAIKNTKQENTHCGKVPERFLKKQAIVDTEKLLEKAMLNSDLNQVNRLSYRLKQLKEEK